MFKVGDEVMVPLGSRVVFTLNSRQVILTEGIVIAHEGEGYVRVRCMTLNEMVRSIFYRDIY